MYRKLAARNVKRSFRDYGVYFLTLTVGVCIFYMFNSIGGQRAVMELTSGQAGAIRLLERVMGAASVLVSVILGFLILYANRFLLKRRKKEFGLYMLLGMEKSGMSRILMAETALVGVAALGAGLPLGVLLSQGMALVTARLLEANVGGLQFVFSGEALWKTIAYFGLAFIVALAFNVASVRRQKLIDLLNAARRNETYRAPRPALSALIFIVSLACIGAAYKLALSDGAYMYSGTLSAAALLGAVGTLLLLYSASGFFLKVAQLRRKRYLRDLNMFVTRQLGSRINTAFVSMTLVCLMLFVSICTLSSGMGISKAIAEDMRASTPFDATANLHGDADGDGLAASLAGLGVRLDSFAGEYVSIKYRDAEADIGQGAAVVALSEFNAVLAMQGLGPISLGAREYAVNLAVRCAQWSGDEISPGGSPLSLAASGVYEYRLETTSQAGREVFVAVAPDEVAAGLPVARESIIINYPGDGGDYERLCRAALDGARVGDTRVVLETRTQILDTTGTATAVVSYIAVYLGVVFMLACVTVLAIGQLSEASDNAARYLLLRKLGADEVMVSRALFKQIMIYFAVPLLPAIVHSVAGIKMANNIVGVFGGLDILASSVFTSAFMVAIYGGYFLATYLGSKRIISP
jgi:putative ABC transport system permease protein